MKRIYINQDYLCSLSAKDGYKAVETNLFDNISDFAVNYFRYIPNGETWTDKKGNSYRGAFLFPKDEESARSIWAIQKQAEIDSNANLAETALLMDEIETLCNELIGG